MNRMELEYKPLYRQVYAMLHDRITSSFYKIGEELPSEKSLAAEFKVSISTIRQAVGLLVEEGLVIRKQGKGTFVSNNPITLKFFGWIGETRKGEQAISRIIEAFKKKNPNLEVEYINGRYEDLKNTYIEMVQNGNPPDVVQIDGYWTSSLASMGLLEPLGSLLPANNILNRDPEVDLKSGMYKRQLFSVAWGLGPSALVYNKKLAKKFGLKLDNKWALDDFARICSQISDHPENGGVAAFGLANNIDIIYNIYPFLSLFNAELVDENGEVAIERPEMLLAFEWLRGLITKNRIVIGEDLRELRQYLIEDQVVFLQDGPWIRGILQEATGCNDISDHFGVIVNPRQAKALFSSFTRNHSLAISSISSKKDVAGKFIDALTNDPELNELFVNDTGLLPANRKLSDSWNDDAYFHPFLEQLEKSRPFNASNPLFDKTLKFAADAAVNILFNEHAIEAELQEKAYYLRMLYND